MAGGRRGKKRRRSSSSSETPNPAVVGSAKHTSPPSEPKRTKRELCRQIQSAPNSTHQRPPSFLDKMRARLSGGHFRMLNERLYTSSGNEAFNLFKDDPKLFDVYHAGYREQMSRWPEKPVGIIIKWLKNHNPSWTVADFGCGSASLAKNVKNEVYSIDLVSSDPSVIACDMAHVLLREIENPIEMTNSTIYDDYVPTGGCKMEDARCIIGNSGKLLAKTTFATPLESSSVDVAVFCLSLMGTNFPNYLQEANRVLNSCGWLLIAEVRSRFDPNNGGADPGKFSEAVEHLGFSLVSKDMTNKMFLLFYFKKKESAPKVKNIEWPELKPCLYKRR